jgi:hypothetical protein
MDCTDKRYLSKRRTLQEYLGNVNRFRPQKVASILPQNTAIRR